MNKLDKMDNICVRLDASLSRQIDRDMREFHYSTKTDFVRDAIRAKLSLLDEQRAKKRAWEALYSARGSLNGKGKFKTAEEFHDWRSNEGSKEMLEYFDKRFGLKK